MSEEMSEGWDERGAGLLELFGWVAEGESGCQAEDWCDTRLHSSEGRAGVRIRGWGK